MHTLETSDSRWVFMNTVMLELGVEALNGLATGDANGIEAGRGLVEKEHRR
ncbi:MAG: hypothetical protein R2705_15320 [Ilumatobacteraceae bacterium]